MSSLEKSATQKTKPITKPSPLLLVIMGVSGSGKTTLASEYAKRHQFTFLDADSLHSDQAIQQMSQGNPLTNEQRLPWIQRIHDQLCHFEAENKNCILAYSGLKQAHRKVVFSAYTHRAGVLLRADKALIMQRLATRSDHFMPPQLLDSQLNEMQPLDEKELLLILNSADAIAVLMDQLQHFVTTLTTK